MPTTPGSSLRRIAKVTARASAVAARASATKVSACSSV